MDTKKLWYVALGLLLLIIFVLAVDDMQVKGANNQLYNSWKECMAQDFNFPAGGPTPIGSSTGIGSTSPKDTNELNSALNSTLINNVFN